VASPNNRDFFWLQDRDIRRVQLDLAFEAALQPVGDQHRFACRDEGGELCREILVLEAMHGEKRGLGVGGEFMARHEGQSYHADEVVRARFAKASDWL
jgi:hypothetical protein